VTTIQAVMQERQEAINDQAANAQNRVERLYDIEIANMPFDDRYDLIHHIQEGILARAPATPPKRPYQPIDESAFKPQMRAIERVSDTLRLSDRYKDFVIDVSRSAALELAENTSEISKLLKWQEYDDITKSIHTVNFMHSLMGHFQSALRSKGASEDFISAVKPVGMKFPVIPPSISEDASVLTFIGGRANFDIKQLPDQYHVDINRSPEAMLDTPGNATEVIAHEYAHIIEATFAFMHAHHAPFIPPQFQRDAALLEAMHRKGGYISSRLHSEYEKQANELVAFEAGKTARHIITGAIHTAQEQAIQPRPQIAALGR